MDGGKIINVVAAVIVGGGKILIAKRLPGGPHGGMWEFPGGKVEPGENSREALVREIGEELGIEVMVGRKLAEVTHRYPEFTINLTAFVCRAAGGEVQTLQCEAAIWVKPGELADYTMPDADLPIIDKCNDDKELFD